MRRLACLREQLALTAFVDPAQKRHLIFRHRVEADDREFITNLNRLLDERLGAAREIIAQMEGVSMGPTEGAFYLYVGFSFDSPMRSTDLTKRLLSEGVAVRSGTEFGPAGEGYLRLTYSATFDDIREGTQLIHRVFEQLSG